MYFNIYIWCEQIMVFLNDDNSNFHTSIMYNIHNNLFYFCLKENSTVENTFIIISFPLPDLYG